ncbi:hypothetical protein DUZ28_23195 [Escherichia coli]|nr:hypothetical protein [Escherichia coli]
MKDGIYFVVFRSNQRDFGNGTVVVKNNAVNGGDFGFTYQGKIDGSQLILRVCLRAGVVREAKTVDHIIPKAHGGTDADSNLQSLCWPCHKAKTARERLK